MAGKMDCYGLTDVGLKREVNEDQFLIADLNKAMRVHQTSLSLDPDATIFGNSQGMMLLVADGMGGHAEGEQASRLAVESLTTSILNSLPWFFSRDAEGSQDLKGSLERAVHEAQERLQEEVRQHPTAESMGTTLTAAYINWPQVTIVHAGDSRCYLYRAGKLTQITTDHTVAQQLAAGDSHRTRDLAKTRWAHMLWNAIGSGDAEVQPEVHQFDLELNDTLLLCTDGLIRHAEPARIATILSENRMAKETCRQMVDCALAGGGVDNVTVVVARFLDQRQAKQALEAETEVLPAVDRFSDTAIEVSVVTEGPPESLEQPDPIAEPASVPQ
jgi:protein phosphatase